MANQGREPRVSLDIRTPAHRRRSRPQLRRRTGLPYWDGRYDQHVAGLGEGRAADPRG